jgi:hypothetical protein
MRLHILILWSSKPIVPAVVTEGLQYIRIYEVAQASDL